MRSLRVKGKGSEAGFSLVELMVVVAIIGILAALAVPRFQTFQAKARQSEAKTNLSHIYTLEQAYHGENTTYVTVAPIGAIATPNCAVNNAIGFKLTDCSKVRYQYTVGTATTTAFTGTASNTLAARKVNPTCPATTSDTWTINQDKAMVNTVDATAC